MPQVSAPRGQPASSGAASPSPGAKPGAAALSQHASLREAEERAHRRRVVSETGQLGEWGTLSEIDLARPLRGSQRRQADVVERADADHGSAGNKLSTVVHSHAHVPERLKGSIDQGVIYVYDQTRVERSGVGIVFVLLQPYHTTDTPQAASPSGAAEEEEIRILSVDHNGPADKGQARKGDMLVGVDGHLVKGKTWEEVRQLVECVYTYICTHTYIHIYIYIYTYIPTYLHTYIPTYLHTYIPTYLHTYIPTYIHTHTHMYT